MANWWDQYERAPEPQAGGNWWEKYPEAGAAPAPAAAPAETRSALDAVKDTGVALLKGAVGLPQAVVGLADIPTGGRVGKALEEVGYRPGAAKEMIDEWYSPQQKAANQAVQQADGFVDTTVAALQNPSAIAGAAIESLPQMLGGAGVARGAMKLAPKLAPWLAGAAGEGTLAAGAAAAEAREKNADGLLTDRQALAAVGSGVGTAAFGAAGGKLAQHLGLGDVDTMLAAGTSKLSKAPPGFIKQVIGSGISEGALEELPQSIQEKMWENWGAGKPRDEGVGNAAAMGLLTGAAMGVAGGGYTAARGGRGEAAPSAPTAAPGATDPINADEVLGAAASATNREPLGATPEVASSIPGRSADGVGGVAPTQARAEPDPLTAAPSAPSALPKVRATPGAETEFSTETGARLQAQYALVEAEDLQSSHDESLRPNPAFPPELQPRERDRAASAQQIQGIVGRLDPARLGASADAATGAPIIGDDGLVESGNARTIALKRVYQANGQKAEDYRAFLRANAAQFGLDPAAVDTLRKPVLVRVRTTPVDRAEFARQANASTVAQMSPSEQARADAARIDAMDDLEPTDDGDFATSRDFIRRFMARLPQTEQASMMDAGGRLSTTGYARVRNAVLAKAYGDSPVLTRMVESLDDNLRNISRAMMIAAPRVAKARDAIGAGRLHDADLTPHLVGAAEWLSSLKDSGTSVDDALAQAGLLGDDAAPETRDMLRFLADNARRPRRIAEFVGAYFDGLEAAGDPGQASLLDETAPPTAAELMSGARRATEEKTNAVPRNAADPQRGVDRETAPAGERAAGQPADAPGSGSGDQGDGAAGAGAEGSDRVDARGEGAASESVGPEWVDFQESSGTLGIPRAKMPQVKVKVRPHLYAFLESRGITNELQTVDAASLKPTQREYSPRKAEGARTATGEAAGVLVSSDGYVLDGHHRWMSRIANGERVDVRRFSAPIDQLLDAAREFSGTTTSNESEALREKRAEHVERFYDAAADLADILTKHQRAAMVPEDTPGLMPTLIKLFGEAVAIVGTDIRRATAWVKDRMKAEPQWKKLWNKVSDETYRKAALQAIEQGDAAQNGGDLFSQPEKPAQGEERTAASASDLLGRSGAPRAVATPDDQPGTGTAVTTRGPTGTHAIDDAGEKIGGARKDWRERGLTAADLDAMTEAEGAQLATKANAWKPDYAAMVADGAPPEAAAMVKVVYDALAARPKTDTPDGRRDYMRAMQVVRQVYGAVRTVDEAKGAYLQLRAALGVSSNAGMRSLDKDSPEAKARRVLFSVYKGRSDPFVLGFNEVARARKLVVDGFPGAVEPWTRRLVLRSVGGSGLTDAGLVLYEAESAKLGTPMSRAQLRAGVWQVRDKAGKVQAFAATKADAEAAARAVYERAREGGSALKDPERPHLDRLLRTGLTSAIDRDVTPQDFLDDFGFRGVEFGNWAAQDERQKVLNLAYEALTDLAMVLNLPRRALSLNGSLGMAFGARGGGNFAAHYEAGKLVINVTKLRGAGSLAHEWAHAFDHYLGELDRSDAYQSLPRGASGWMDEARYDGKPQQRMERGADGKWAPVERMRLGNLRPELAEKIDAVMSALVSGRQSKADMLAEMDATIERVQGYASSKEADARLRAMYEAQLENYRAARRGIESDPAGTTYPKGRSQFAAEAQKLSGKSSKGYWLRPTEMFARAFEAYVFDRIVAMGARSDYLVHGVEGERYAGDGYRGNPYPTGEERAAINRTFDALVAELKVRPGPEGRLAIHEQGAPYGPSAAEREAAADRFPPVAGITDISVGPGGRIKPRPIAPGRQLYRETNVDGLDDLLRLDSQAEVRSVFVTDNRDLALGQHGNRGVLVTFRPDSLSGTEHAKPGTGAIAGREYRTDLVAPRAVQAVEMAAAGITKLRLLTRRRLAQEFDRVPMADARVRFVRMGLAPQGAAPMAADAPANDVASTERDVYPVAEPGSTADVPLDLFPDTLGDLQPVQGRAGGVDRGERPGRTEGRDLRSAAPVPRGTVDPNVVAVRQDPAFPGTYHYSTQLVEVGRRELPVSRVTDWQQAASALQSMRRYAVEHFDVLVTNKDGKPLAVIGSFKGAQSQASVYPATILAEALRIKGAARLWASHNHPSGVESLSRADERLNESLARTFEPTSLQWMGVSAVGRDRFEAVGPNGDKFTGELVAGGATVSVPIAERTIAPANHGMPVVDSPSAARRIVAEAAQHQSGLVFVDAQNRLTAWVPLDADTMQELRREGRFDRLVNSASEAGAASAFVANPGGGFGGRALRNITNALARADIRVLDAIDTRSGESAAERGLMPDAGGTVFSRATSRVPQPRVAQGRDDSGAPFWVTPEIEIAFPADTDNLAVQPEPGERVLNYAILPAGEFGVQGFVELLVRDGAPVALLDIEVAPDLRGAGVGRKVIEALLAANQGAPIEISNIVEASRGFWARMGIPEQNRAAGEAYDAILTWTDYARAQAGLAPLEETDQGARAGRASFSRAAQGAGATAAAAALRGRGRIGVEALQAVADRIAAALPGLPTVHVLQSPQDLEQDGSQGRLRALIDERGAADDVEGALHEGELYLFASGIADELTAEHVLAEHEAAHAGLRGLLGAGVRSAMTVLHNENAEVRRLAAPLIKSGMPLAEAVEEAIVDIPSARLARLQGWRKVVGKVRDVLRARGFERAAAAIDRWLAGHLTQQQLADLAVADLVRAARAFGARKPGRQPAAAVASALLSRSAMGSVSANIDRGMDALAKAVTGRTTVHRAMFRSGMGWVDFVWGGTGTVMPSGRTQGAMGLAHIIEARMRKDGLSESQAIGLLGELVRTIAAGEEFKRDTVDSSVRVGIRHDGYIAWLARRSGSNAWVVTGYGVDPDARPVGRAAGTTTQTAASRTRDGMGAGSDDSVPRLSRAATTVAAAQGDAAQRADTIIQTAASTPKPLDTLARKVTSGLFIDRLTAMAYDKGARLIDRLTPEAVKAGVISDYGVPEAVIDRRALMVGAQRTQLASAGKLLEKLATLTRAESRVAYEWMNMDGSDPRAYVSMMQGLPEESVRVLQDVQKLIDELSQEAVRLGQLDAEAFKRHRFAYLRRSYFKHVQELNPQETAARAGAIRILGDQYKGRGMVGKAAMRQVQNAAPEWWKRKMTAGQADTSLKGERLERLERRAPSGERTANLPDIGGRAAPGRVLEVHYWPVGEPKPARYADWDSAGVWEVRDTKGDDLIVWRDFTKDERERMGEIDEARFAIAKTLHGMIHDIEVGKYLEWLAQSQAKATLDGVEGVVVAASERALDVFKPGTWVQVPEAKIPGTSVARYGKLAGRYIPGPVWSDLRQIMGGNRIGPEWYRTLLRAWKSSKTALSPGVHTNNVMSNFVMADWHDVSAGHVAKALRIILGASEGKGAGVLGRVAKGAKSMGLADAEAARAIMERYEASGGAIGGWVTSEIAKEQIAPIVELLQAEVGAAAQAAGTGGIGVYSALQHLLHARFPDAWESFKGSKPAKIVATEGASMIDLYQAEDDVFRLAAWLKAKEDGASDADAGKRARKSFLDYSINAPWVSAMRQTALPFVAFTYRAVPMLLETAAKRPHKLIKLMALAGALNALGTLIGGGGDDKERKLLPEEKAGRIWGMVPKLIRMPWNDAHGSPVYLDIRRWIPVGDVIDTGQGHAAFGLPPVLVPGGPLALLGELIANKSQFTGRPITLETDTATEKVSKVLDHLYKAFAPNIAVLPGTYAWQGVADATKGKTDKFGREMSVPAALLNAMGVKLGAYPADVLRNQVIARREAQLAEIGREKAALRRQLMVNGISQEDFDERLQRQLAKEREVRRKAAEKLAEAAQ